MKKRKKSVEKKNNYFIIFIKVLNNMFKISLIFSNIFLSFTIFNNSEYSKNKFKKIKIKLISLLIILLTK